VNTSLLNGTTNPMCRAGYLGLANMVSLLLKFGGDINLRSSDGRTALMWAAFRNNAKMTQFLLDHGSDVTLNDNQGWNALDIAIIKMNYEAALVLKKAGLEHKDKSLYEPHLWQKYDVGLFIEYLEEGREQVEYPRFFDLIKSMHIITDEFV
jgi:ankyrin repeat protein